ncbi:hypothetical protein NQ318_001829 [Aromia moschata]|uniref:Uncharacterized protein n=1 Tax=Aromia moschata TaxID=1265417 RepID=A0AAV8Z3Z7_9CUCU|nr:hypothetical protein NQ318_001829 [Aromia moschata]
MEKSCVTENAFDNNHRIDVAGLKIIANVTDSIQLDTFECVQKQPLDNNPTFRGFSNKLDSALGWGGYEDPKQSTLRAVIHAGYHEMKYHQTGNPREHERAKDQWGVATGGPTNNLKNFDAGNKKK